MLLLENQLRTCQIKLSQSLIQPDLVLDFVDKIKVVDTFYEIRETHKIGATYTFEKIIAPFPDFEDFYKQERERIRQHLNCEESSNKKSHLQNKHSSKKSINPVSEFQAIPKKLPNSQSQNQEYVKQELIRKKVKLNPSTEP